METKKIDLFKLIDEDERRPGSWVMAKGENLNAYLEPLIEKAGDKFGSKRKFCKYLMDKFNLSQPTSQRFVWLMKDWHPLFLIREATNLNNTSYFEIQEHIEFLKMNWPPLKTFKAVKELNEDLCKIIGAHAADGTLARNFVRITDGYESNIVALKKWIKNVFGVSYPIKKVEGSNEWKIEFHSGIIAGYLNRVFDFPIGSKQYTVLSAH